MAPTCAGTWLDGETATAGLTEGWGEGEGGAARAGCEAIFLDAMYLM